MFGKFFERKKILFFLAISFLILPFFVFADTFGKSKNFMLTKDTMPKAEKKWLLFYKKFLIMLIFI